MSILMSGGLQRSHGERATECSDQRNLLEHQELIWLMHRLNLKLLVLLCLTLGLAPYHPEPHIIGKIRWVAGGAVGMKPIDWADLVMHAIPWILLIGAIVSRLKRK